MSFSTDHPAPSIHDTSITAEDRRMSLLHRYTRLGEEASAMRKRRETLQEDIETMRDEQQALRHEDQRLQQGAHDAKSCTTAFQEKIEVLKRELSQVRHGVEEVKCARDAARRRRDDLKQTLINERLLFLESSLVFRDTCKRLRATALACGLDQAAYQAYLGSSGCHPNTENDDQDVRPDNDCLDDPETWSVQSSDDELASELKVYLEQKQVLDQASLKLEEAENEKQATWKRSRSRQEQEDELDGQLQRILKDNQDLEQQIQETQRLVEESCQKKEALVRAKSITNPYMLKKGTNGFTERPQMKDSLTPPSSTTLERSRSVSTLSNDRRIHLRSVALGSHVHGAKEQYFTSHNELPGSRVQLEGEDLDRNNGVDNENKNGDDSVAQKEATLSRSKFFLDQDDDEDDEEVLHFEAFSVKRRNT